MRFVKEPLWPQPLVPWWLQVGAVAAWCGVAALAAYGLALTLPYPWSEVGWLSFLAALLAVVLGLGAVALAPRFQKALGMGALVACALFVVALWST